MPPREYLIVRDYSGRGGVAAWPPPPPRARRGSDSPRGRTPVERVEQTTIIAADDSSDDDLDGLIEARETSWGEIAPPSAARRAPSREFDDSDDEAEPARWEAVSDVDEAPPVAEPTRWVRAWEAAVGGDDDESESESEEEAPPPPHKRRRTTKTAAAPRPRTSFLSKYYGVTFKKETKK